MEFLKPLKNLPGKLTLWKNKLGYIMSSICNKLQFLPEF